MRTAFAAFVIVLMAAAVGLAADAPPATAPATAPSADSGPVELSLPPAAFPRPALRYALVPEMSDRTSGDAAPLYLMAFSRLKRMTEGHDLYDLLDAPREKFSIAAAQKILDAYQGPLDQITVAARRDRCRWDLPMREQGYATLIPYLNVAHDAAALFALQARVQIAQGRFDDALHTLQSGFGMVAHQANDEECLPVEGLVAMEGARLLLDRVQEFIQTPGAPNLYWALGELPHPMANMRTMISTERAMMQFAMPELKAFGEHNITASQIDALLKRMGEMGMGMTADAYGAKNKFVAGLKVPDGPARKWLGEHGYEPKRLKGMSADEAVGLYYIESYQRASDNLFKWAVLPWWQAQAGYEKSIAELERLMDAQAGNPLLFTLPSIRTVHWSMTKTDRRIAMLRIAEALRGYAAAHDGHLPASLADLENSPAPLDPMTGQPFAYEVTGNIAVLRSLAPPQRKGDRAETYRISLNSSHGK